EGAFDAERGVAAQDVTIERIESEAILIVPANRAGVRKTPALGRLRIDVVEMAELGWVFQIPERREAMALDLALLRRDGEAGQCRCEGAGRPAERLPARETRRPAEGSGRLRHERDPTFAARSASHHHTVGKPPAA